MGYVVAAVCVVAAAAIVYGLVWLYERLTEHG